MVGTKNAIMFACTKENIAGPLMLMTAARQVADQPKRTPSGSVRPEKTSTARERVHRRDRDRDELGPSEPPRRWLVAMRFAGSQWCASAASYTGTASARERQRGRCTRCDPAIASGDQGLVDRVWVCPVVQVKPVPGFGNPFGLWRISWVVKCRYQSWPYSKAGAKQGS